jgi:hypothetical protein
MEKMIMGTVLPPTFYILYSIFLLPRQLLLPQKLPRPYPEVQDVLIHAVHDIIVAKALATHPSELRVFMVKRDVTLQIVIMEKVDFVPAAVKSIPDRRVALDEFDLEVVTQLLAILAEGTCLRRFAGFHAPRGEAPQSGSPFLARASAQEQEAVPVVFDEVDGKTGDR